VVLSMQPEKDLIGGVALFQRFVCQQVDAGSVPFGQRLRNLR
jgi:hypothetical protein